MAIYGTALLSLCVIFGSMTGTLLGRMLGLNANVGGVGIAMLLLIYTSNRLRKTGILQPPSEAGILFWSSIYIPIVVAIAATQNVQAALHGGPAAIIAGVLAVVACVSLVPLISRIGRENPSGDGDA